MINSNEVSHRLDLAPQVSKFFNRRRYCWVFLFDVFILLHSCSVLIALFDRFSFVCCLFICLCLLHDALPLIAFVFVCFTEQGHLFVRLDYLGPPVAKLSLQKGTSMLNVRFYRSTILSWHCFILMFGKHHKRDAIAFMFVLIISFDSFLYMRVAASSLSGSIVQWR